MEPEPIIPPSSTRIFYEGRILRRDFRLKLDPVVVARFTAEGKKILPSVKQYLAMPFIPLTDSMPKPSGTLIKGWFYVSATVKELHTHSAGEGGPVYALREVDTTATAYVVDANTTLNIGPPTLKPRDYEPTHQSLRHTLGSQHSLVRLDEDASIRVEFTTLYPLREEDQLYLVILLSAPELILQADDFPPDTVIVRPKMQLTIATSYTYI